MRDKFGKFVKKSWNKGENNPFYGKHHTEETRKLFKKINTSSNNPFYGKKHDDKWKIDMSKIQKGRKHSKETKQKISETRKRLFKEGKLKSPNLRKKFSEEHRKKLSEIRLKNFKEGKIKIWNKGLKGIYSGTKNPNWRGGLSFEPYTSDFNEKFKRAIRKRDNYICLKCGIHREKLNKTLDIHHINYDKKLSIPQNCCTLCHKCHSEVNFNRIHWIKFFQSLLAERYSYQYSETGEIEINLGEKNA